MKEINQRYRIVETIRSRKNAPEEKSNMSRAIKTKLSQNQCNRKIKVCEKFGIKVHTNTREALIMDRMNNNNLCSDDITKEMSALERLGVFQYYPPKTKFENNYGWKWAPMRILFDIK